MIKRQTCRRVYLCAHRYTHKHTSANFSWLCQNLLVVSCRQDFQWQLWRKWAKITRAIPETFQSKDIPVCSTLQQFNTVFRSNVVIVLSFSLYPVILNDRVEERITQENVFFFPACLCLFMFLWTCVSVVMYTLNVCTCSYWTPLQYVQSQTYSSSTASFKNKDNLMTTENKKVTWTFFIYYEMTG